jgi:hypothetical protein
VPGNRIVESATPTASTPARATVSTTSSFR